MKEFKRQTGIGVVQNYAIRTLRRRLFSSASDNDRRLISEAGAPIDFRWTGDGKDIAELLSLVSSASQKKKLAARVVFGYDVTRLVSRVHLIFGQHTIIHNRFQIILMILNNLNE